VTESDIANLTVVLSLWFLRRIIESTERLFDFSPATGEWIFKVPYVG